MSDIAITIIVVSRNRAEDLRATLASIAQCQIPTETPAETIAVDNEATDDTPAVIKAARFDNMAYRPLRIAKGKCRGLNAAIKEARGAVLIFTDDDVRVPTDWVQRMAAPILEGRADGVCGGARPAAHLVRESMSKTEKGLMVSSEFTPPEELADPMLIGVNMACRRSCMETLGGFDEEIGPGTPYAACEDVLFSLQFKQAGFKIVPAMDVIVEHHFDAARMTRAGFLARPRLEGKASAYIRYHWQHEAITLPRLRLMKHHLRLMWAKVKHAGRRGGETVPDWEIERIRDIEFYKQYLLERKRGHVYGHLGLVKNGHGPLIEAHGLRPVVTFSEVEVKDKAHAACTHGA